MAATDEAYEEAVVIHDGKCPGLRAVKSLHDQFHGVVCGQARRTLRHQIADEDTVVELGAEHHMAHAVEDKDGKELAGIIYDREDIAVGG